MLLYGIFVVVILFSEMIVIAKLCALIGVTLGFYIDSKYGRK